MTPESTRFSLLRELIASTLVIAIAVPPTVTPAFAAEYDEIVVTALGRETSLKDSPAAVSVVTQDTIERKGIERVEDFVNLVPGMSIVNTAEVADTQVNIRGLNGARDGEINYALVVDGVVMTDRSALNREWNNAAQIEVLKGPQSALYGRSAAAGAIVITTKKPQESFEADGKAIAGENSSYLVNGRLGGRVSDQWGWQVSGTYRDTDGFYKDEFNGEDDVIDNFETWSVDGRLLWDPTDDLSFDLKARYGEVDASSIVFNSIFHLPEFAAGLGIPSFAEDVNGHTYRFYPNVESSNDQDALELSLRVDYDLGWADLIGWGLYSDIDNSLGADGTSGAFGFFWTDPDCVASTFALGPTNNPPGGFPTNPPTYIGDDPVFPNSLFGAYTPTTCDGTQYQERNQDDYSFEIRLRSKDDQRLRWEGGFYYLNIDREVGVNLGIDRGFGIVESLFTTDPRNPTEQLLWDDFDTDVWAVFGQLNYDITDDLEAGFYLRYDKEDREAESKVPTNATTQYLVCQPGAPFTGGDPINPGLCPQAIGSNPRPSDDWDELQPKASLSWQATDRLNLFGSIGVGFKSGGFNNFGSQATVNTFINTIPTIADGTFSRVGIFDQYDEETSTAVEAGFRTSIGDTIQLDGAAYYIDVDDMQFFEFFVGQFGLLRVVSNMDEVEIKGIELNAAWSPFEWLDIQANGNYIDSEIEDNSSRPDTEGNDAPYTPEWTFYVSSDATWPITPQVDLIGTLSVTGTGKTWFHSVQDQGRPTIFFLDFPANTIPATGQYGITERESYALVDLRAGVAGETWSLVAVGKNILDKNYIRESIPAPEFGGSFNSPGDRSWWGVEFTLSFSR